MDYKNTLNLPSTNFSMKANLSSLEPKIMSLWESLNIYSRLRRARKNNEKFVLHDGPPYANGLIHIGHALNKILKDIIIKYKILKGYDCPYIIGWDCHGLPVEHQLFKELKLTKHDVEITEFRKGAKNYALKFVDLQKEDFRRLGLFSDWDNPYLTLNPQYEHDVISLLGDLSSSGYVYRGRKPVNWCWVCETALAEAEVEYQDKVSDSIYFLFKVTGSKNLFKEKANQNVSFLVWTTTPWTLISNVAVALHPDMDYKLVKFQNDLVVLGEALMPALEKKFSVKFTVIKSFKGADFEGLKLRHPFFDRDSSLVLADFVSKEEGSGCVHIAPGHGQEDFSLTKKYKLDIIMPVNDKGVFEEPREFKGKSIKEANILAIEKLKDNGALVRHEEITHSYPHCWRCKQPVIFRATFQWFLNVDYNDLRQKILKEIETVRWVPLSGKDRMKAMLLSRPDWCLSRQRLWGIPIPAVRCKSCGEVMLHNDVINKTAGVFKEKGADSWFSMSIKEFLPEDFKCFKCGHEEFAKEFDILDVWFESGASFTAVLKRSSELKFPADLYLEGSDQHRGWFQVSLIPSVAKENISPFKTILTHGFVVDADGRKMSKSLGNVIAPQKIIKQYGAEILRLWAAYSDYTEDIKISEGIIKQLTDMYRKVRNTIRFILGNTSDFCLKESKISYNQLLEIDKLMAAKAACFLKEAISYYDDFSFYKVCQKIFNFCNLDLSSFYLDILKDRLYTFSQNSRERRSAQFVLYHILDILLKIIAPILSFTSEEAYQAWDNNKDKKESIFVTGFEESGYEKWLDESLISRWDKVLDIRSKVLKEIEKKREEGVIGSSLEAAVLLKCKSEQYEVLSSCRDMLQEVFIISEVIIEKGDFEIIVKKAQGKKCARCWNWRHDVGGDEDYPEICGKCSAVLKEAKDEKPFD